MTPRPLRFGLSVRKAASLNEWCDLARRAEDAGFDCLQMPDHLGKQFAVGPALASAAAVTSQLRLGCFVYAMDFHHPALLAKEVSTLDLLSNGRIEVGVGAGWNKEEYDAVGSTFEPPGIRVSRMEEATRILKRLWTEDCVTHQGSFYSFRDYASGPAPVQRPHPPLMIGGGGRRVLSFAGAQADIVGIVQMALPGGGLDHALDSRHELVQKHRWIMAAAADRERPPELHLLFWNVCVGERLTPPSSPHDLAGSQQQIIETILDLRETLDISYFTVLQKDLEAFAPIVHRLRGR